VLRMKGFYDCLMKIQCESKRLALKRDIFFEMELCLLGAFSCNSSWILYKTVWPRMVL